MFFVSCLRNATIKVSLSRFELDTNSYVIISTCGINQSKILRLHFWVSYSLYLDGFWKIEFCKIKVSLNNLKLYIRCIVVFNTKKSENKRSRRTHNISTFVCRWINLKCTENLCKRFKTTKIKELKIVFCLLVLILFVFVSLLYNTLNYI